MRIDKQTGTMQYEILDPATGRPAIVRCACGTAADGMLEGRFVCIDCAGKLGYDISGIAMTRCSEVRR